MIGWRANKAQVRSGHNDALNSEIAPGREAGFPAVIQVNRCSQFVPRDLGLWAYQRGVTLDLSRMKVGAQVTSAIRHRSRRPSPFSDQLGGRFF